ncbi:hypothetical protein QPL79_07005 [Ignisphaera sp. 4213-co]|uniref:Transcription elongation factor n=1 Tax=Ignisphaera cupida TaxID=3050454 RepID=A0ABD4Z7J8_9CREN|nr:hypothetical protein [Ignisphaera sp. 4213-co]MDK6029109.1 hypothetical protein [Ignisphaera sp. 4213-co]
MARRRSKWRRSTVIVKKLMQEARKVRAYQSLQQCPVCGDPHGLSIEIRQNKNSGVKSAYVRCSTCKFEYVFETIPSIADEFWVYSKLLDLVYSGTIKPKQIVSMKTESAESIEAEVVAKESQLEVEESEEKTPDIEVVEEE